MILWSDMIPWSYWSYIVLWSYMSTSSSAGANCILLYFAIFLLRFALFLLRFAASLTSSVNLWSLASREASCRTRRGGGRRGHERRPSRGAAAPSRGGASA